MRQYEAVIGLEVHAQLLTKSKLFCSCSVDFGAKPNENVCEVCGGLPGALPKLNKQAVELAVKAGHALNCTINEISLFDRKSYFYPDLPDGYQISQFSPPICEHGKLRIVVNDKERVIGITRIHLEDDAGKCVHASGKTLVDLNRAGTALIEIVSEPDIRSAEEAATYMRAIHSILVYAGVTDGNMEEGSMRCDANVSIRPLGSTTFGTRAEIKNLNSFRNIQKAIEFEIERQIACVEDGEQILQETRLYDAVKQITIGMRSKEDAQDYRYFTNPDLPPVHVTEEQIALWKSELPEFPEQKKARFISQYKLNEEEASALVIEKSVADFFEQALKAHNSPKRLAHLLLGELLRECSSRNCSLLESPMSPERLAELAKLIDSGVISAKIAHDIFSDICTVSTSLQQFVEEKGLVQVSDSSELESLIQEVLNDNPEEVQAYKEGKTKLMSFFVGQVMKKSKGKANPGLVSQLLDKLLAAS